MIEYRTFKIVPNKDKRYYNIIPAKGKVASKLSGLYTSVAEARNRIDAYIGVPNVSETKSED